MTRAEMLARMESRELSAWYALYRVRHDEAEYERHRAESGDGVVVITGRGDEDEDGEE